MYISRQLKQQNIAEYLLYMWQVEDMLRANELDIERVRSVIIDTYPGLSDTQKCELLQWYEELIDMMRSEGVEHSGHIQMNKNVIIWLTDLHLRLLNSPKFPYYTAAYYKALPFIVELRAKGAHKDESEIETCFAAMYGMLLLKLRHKEIAEQTREAMKIISDLLALLADYYKKEKQGELDLE